MNHLIVNGRHIKNKIIIEEKDDNIPNRRTRIYTT